MSLYVKGRGDGDDHDLDGCDWNSWSALMVIVALVETAATFLLKLALLSTINSLLPLACGVGAGIVLATLATDSFSQGSNIQKKTN